MSGSLAALIAAFFGHDANECPWWLVGRAVFRSSVSDSSESSSLLINEPVPYNSSAVLTSELRVCRRVDHVYRRDGFG